MKKNELYHEHKLLQSAYANLAHRYQTTRTLALAVTKHLKSALSPCVIDGQEIAEAASEQVERCDQAIQYALIYLNWIEDSSSLSGWQFSQMLREALEAAQPSPTSGLHIEGTRKVGEVRVADPDIGDVVGLTVFKTIGGNMFAIDASYLLHTQDLTIPSPFDIHVFLDLSRENPRDDARHVPAKCYQERDRE